MEKKLVTSNMNVNSTERKRKEKILMKKLRKQKKRVILQLKRIAKEKKALEILNNKLDKIRKLHNENFENIKSKNKEYFKKRTKNKSYFITMEIKRKVTYLNQNNKEYTIDDMVTESYKSEK